MFTAVHGVFVMSLFGDYGDALSGLPDVQLVARIIDDNGLLWAIIALLISHAYSYVVNFLGRGEYLNVTPRQLMSRPYRRIMVLHITIIAGGGLVLALSTPLLGLLLLIGLKTTIDLHAHIRLHEREMQPRGTHSPGEDPRDTS